MPDGQSCRRCGRAWPWLLLALAALPALWYVSDFPDDIDPEFPRVIRPTFNRYPPPAYRLAEPTDTIDCIAVYVSSAAVVLAAWGALATGGPGWRAILAISAAAYWHAATPGPLPDGWHGLGWRNLANPEAPWLLRVALGTAAGSVVFAVAAALRRRSFGAWANLARNRGCLGLAVAAGILWTVGQTGWVDREPWGFWPRWFQVWGLLAGALACLRAAPPAPARSGRAAVVVLLLVSALALSFAGRGLFWYQRPIRRLREVVPNRLYLSAMPTYNGLRLAQSRHRFRTIINLFPEHTPQQSPHWPDELRFVREHGLRYVGSPPDEDPRGGHRFIAETLDVARDPSAWPILVHCHASMDRSPAWVGIYRFVVQGWPLDEALRELERHRGLRPKASVTLLYNRVLPELDPDRAFRDPTAWLLRSCAAGTKDPALLAAGGSDERGASSQSGSEVASPGPARPASPRPSGPLPRR